MIEIVLSVQVTCNIFIVTESLCVDAFKWFFFSIFDVVIDVNLYFNNTGPQYMYSCITVDKHF